jgi:hypothetical protein
VRKLITDEETDDYKWKKTVMTGDKTDNDRWKNYNQLVQNW